jgi:hypothetical protein
LPDNNIPKPAPILVKPKPTTRHCKKARNVFYDDCGFLHELDAYDHILHNIDDGVVLRKKHFDAPALDEDNLVFNYEFSQVTHGNWLKTELDLSHLTPKDGAKLTALIK